jgi:hypothetical protein
MDGWMDGMWTEESFPLYSCPIASHSGLAMYSPFSMQFFHKNCYFSENFQNYGTGGLFDSENIRKKP